MHWTICFREEKLLIKSKTYNTEMKLDFSLQKIKSHRKAAKVLYIVNELLLLVLLSYASRFLSTTITFFEEQKTLYTLFETFTSIFHSSLTCKKVVGRSDSQF